MRYSIVIPILNEIDTLPVLHERLAAAMRPFGDDYEIVFVDDGSTDGSAAWMSYTNGLDPRVKCVSFSRNFGHSAAISAGLDHCRGDIVILMDGDLQDPPELVPELLEKLNEGFDVVYAIKRKRREGLLKRLAFRAFYRLQAWLSVEYMPEGAGTFSVMRRPVVDALLSMPERNRYISGLRAWTGFRQTGIEFDRPARHSGKPRQTLGRLIRLALDGLFSFSYVPARLAVFFGFISIVISGVGVCIVIYKKFISQVAVTGWTSELLSTLLLGSVQLICIGIVGEYAARIYDEVRRRPQYLVARRIGMKEEK
jgi:dolichol-phosphate mannosyltransferase